MAGPLAGAPAPSYFRIKVTDEQTGRGVPLVELRTVHNTRYYTDSNGLVAFYEPGLMGQQVFFTVSSHGYEVARDVFGYAGTALQAREGGRAVIRVRRRNIAERLYRITGAGIYRDCILLGEPVPIRQPLLNAQVVGQDSVQAVPWRGRIYWFWGDTNWPRHPLGSFRVSGATSLPPGQGGLDPKVGVDLAYFTAPDGSSKPICPMEGEGPVWIEGLLAAPDEMGRERLAARYTRMKSLGEMLEHGVVVFDEKAEVFTKRAVFDLKDQWRCPRGHPLRVGEHFLFATPYATVRVRADLKHIADPSSYEAFTCLEPGTRYDKAAARVERGPDGHLVCDWKPNTDPLTQDQERELIAAGKIKDGEASFQVQDVETGKPVEMHSGSINWNAYRKKWILIAVQAYGSSSFLGEVWFAEADAPVGPWRWAKKVVTHEQYSFYNPAHHPFFDQEGGRLIYFEGTYAETFSGNPSPTPRYDYNQVMYRLDLADPRLKQPLEPPKARAAPLN